MINIICNLLILILILILLIIIMTMIMIVNLSASCQGPARPPGARRLEACLQRESQIFSFHDNKMLIRGGGESEDNDYFDSQSTLISQVSSRLSSILPSASTLMW